MITRENYEIWFLDYAEGKLNPAQQKMLFSFLEENSDLKKELDSFENISFEKPESKNEINNTLKKKQSWLLEKYGIDELVFNFCENSLSKEELREWNDLVVSMPELVKMVEAERKTVLKPLMNELFDEKITAKKSVSSYDLNQTNYQEHFILYAETKELLLHTAIVNFLKANPSLKGEFELTQKLILKADTSIVFENKNQLKKKERVVAFYQTSSFIWRSVAVAACLILVAIFFYPGENVGINELAETKGTNGLIKKNEAVQNSTIPNNLIEKETNQKSVAINSTLIKNNKRRKGNKNDIKSEDIVPKIIEEKKEEKNFVEVPKNEKKDDMPKPNVPLENEKPENNFANNNSNQKSDLPVGRQESANQKSDDGLNPLNAVASVINKKYYEEQTPKTETASPFYAMKNVVKSFSGGNADIIKKEDSDYKETGFKIGEFKFSRKKNKNKVEVD